MHLSIETASLIWLEFQRPVLADDPEARVKGRADRVGPGLTEASADFAA